MKKIVFPIVAVFVMIVSGCQSGTGGSPKEVLNHFFDAIISKNVDEAKKYVTKDSEGMMGMVQMGMNSIPDSTSEGMFKKGNIEIGDAKIDGDRATVPVKEKATGEVTDFVLKKESGQWKVAFDKSTLMEMAQKKMKEHPMNEMRDSMDGGHENINMDSLQNHLKNLSKEDMEKARKMMDSASKMMQQMQKNQ